MRLLGLDPGGRNNFGWAVLYTGELGSPVSLRTGVCSHVTAALHQAGEVIGGVPDAIGIDAPLFWTDAGDRQADAYIRKLVCAAGGHPGMVGHVNSLRGACLVQGVLAAHRVVELWPSATVTEAHPKALLRISGAAREFIAMHFPDAPTEHQRDAALAAYAAWAVAASFTGWRNLVDEEQAPFFPNGHKVSYWFPVQEHHPSMERMATGKKVAAANIERSE